MSIDSIVKQKSLAFAKRIVGLYQYLGKEHHEHVMSKQVLRSGTSIGANIREAYRAQSDADFIANDYAARTSAGSNLLFINTLG